MHVEIPLTRIDNMRTSTKPDKETGDLVTTISVEARIHPGDIARLLNLQKQKAPLFVNIGSKQAALDLKFEDLKAEPEKVEAEASKSTSEAPSATLPSDGKKEASQLEHTEVQTGQEPVAGKPRGKRKPKNEPLFPPSEA